MSKRFLKNLLNFILAFFLITGASACHRNKGAYNPYLNAKEKPSAKQARETKRILRKGNRAYKKQLQSNRKHLFGRKNGPN